MTDTGQLRSLIENSGIKYKFIAETMGITPYGLQRKIDGINEFKASEIAAFCEILNLGKSERDRIFFAQNVEK